LVARAVAAAGAAARRFDLASDVSVTSDAGGFDLGLAHGRATSASGARVTLSGGEGVRFARGAWRLDGLLALAGGGLPEAAVRLRRAAAGGALRGSGYVRPYAAGDARLALDGLDFTATKGGTRVTSRARLSGPIAGGHVEGLVAPLDAAWRGGALSLNPGCTPLAAERLVIARFTLAAPRLTLCAEGPALARVTAGGVRGAARIAAPMLSGTIGDTPVALAADQARIDLATRAFALTDARAQFGAGERATRLGFETLAGALDRDGARGDFTGGGAQIAQVPLRLDQSAGAWRFADGALTASGALRVSDRSHPKFCPDDGHYLGDPDDRPRFCQLIAKDVTLTLADDRLAATGTLVTPARGVRVAEVALAHHLGEATGHADLSVPGVTFGPTLQPEALTPVTYGVISLVAGTVRGAGRIDWRGDTVRSSGDFRADDLSLAAAFGPVQGVSGAIHFTDLLDLVSAPGQTATIASVNPGVPVTGGVVRYQTLADQRVAVEGGRWPFAGGALVLEPSLLDFAQAAERRLTFRLEGVDAARFLQSFDFKNLNATGVVDGTLPMIFDEHGGRIVGGHLKMRQGGGTIAYVGEVSQRDLGFWGNLAFQSLKSLAYRDLEIDLNGPLEGEMITDIRFAGVRQGQGAKSNFLIRRLQRLPLLFNVRVSAPFRQLLGSVADYYDPTRLIERHLDELREEQRAVERGVQRGASQDVPQGEPK
ncbi:MAG: YdbH domain-containing protein, partial [Sphingomonas sp.]|nr:YdbH domain-containing protein [Sphingomonas sp.]